MGTTMEDFVQTVKKKKEKKEEKKQLITGGLITS